MSKTITLHPRLSEKTYDLSESRVYVVEVPKDANKHTVARAVEAQFEEVKVTKINIVNAKGKSKRTISVTGKRMLNSAGKRSDTKKAYVTLAEGHSLPFFAAIEEEEQKEEALQEKVDKAAAKQAGKEAKKTAQTTAKKSDKPATKTNKRSTASAQTTDTAPAEPAKSHRRRFFLRGRKGKADE